MVKSQFKGVIRQLHHPFSPTQPFPAIPASTRNSSENVSNILLPARQIVYRRLRSMRKSWLNRSSKYSNLFFVFCFCVIEDLDYFKTQYSCGCTDSICVSLSEMAEFVLKTFASMVNTVFHLRFNMWDTLFLFPHRWFTVCIGWIYLRFTFCISFYRLLYLWLTVGWFHLRFTMWDTLCLFLHFHYLLYIYDSLSV